MSVPRAEYDALLQKWVGAELRVLVAEINGTRTAVTVLAEERKAKDEELNNVRFRFIDREVFEGYVREQAKATELYREEQRRKGRAFLVTAVGMGLTIIGLLFTLFAVLQGKGTG